MREQESPYQNEPLNPEPELSKESEGDVIIPTIDVIRHGQTDYKELRKPDFKFEPEAPDFKLDEDHLDLNSEGIETIKASAEQLIETIDRDHEVVLLITSPNYRAHSSALIIENELKGAGIEILGTRKSDSLHAIEFIDPEKDRQRWIEQDTAYRTQDPKHKIEPPDEAHAAIASQLGQEIADIFTENYDHIDLRFQRFLRHMTNLKKWLQPQTKEGLSGKKLRIICLTHEELPVRFMKSSVQTQENLKNGQILEIQPDEQLRKGKRINNRVLLYPKGKSSESGEATELTSFDLK